MKICHRPKSSLWYEWIKWRSGLTHRYASVSAESSVEMLVGVRRMKTNSGDNMEEKNETQLKFSRKKEGQGSGEEWNESSRMSEKEESKERVEEWLYSSLLTTRRRSTRVKECHHQCFHVFAKRRCGGAGMKVPECAQKAENEVRTGVKRLFDRLSVSLWLRGGAERVEYGLDTRIPWSVETQ